MKPLFDFFYAQSLASWCAISLVGNTLGMLLSVLVCHVISKHFQARKLFPATKPITRSDILLAGVCNNLNSSVAVVGWLLWKHGYIVITFPGPFRTLLDTLIYLLVMDAGMYVSHRAAHIPLIFNWVHRTHHEHVETNALSLFVLSPFEVLGFGAMVIAVLLLIPLSGAAILLYLTLNITFGTMGHLGVEPLPPKWMRRLYLRQLGTSTFHCQHHTTRHTNFGFYTVIWDRLFGTLNPDYDKQIEGL